MFYITHLYPTKMSIYGDMGNVLAMQYWLSRLGLEYIYHPVEIGESLPEYTDFYFMGGGQDKDQEMVAKDLETKKVRLKQDVENGIALLTICGGYQLLGKQFVTGKGVELDGLGIFPVVTKSPDSSVRSRCIGNIVVESDILEDGQKLRLVGFENHGG